MRLVAVFGPVLFLAIATCAAGDDVAGKAPSAPPAQTAQGALQTFSLREHGTLEMKVPAGWRTSYWYEPTAKPYPAEVKLEREHGASCSASVGVDWKIIEPDSARHLERIRAMARHVADFAPLDPGMSAPSLEDLKGDQVRGAYFTLTHKIPPTAKARAGEQEANTFGLLALGDLDATFSLTEPASGICRGEILAMVRSIRLKRK